MIPEETPPVAHAPEEPPQQTQVEVLPDAREGADDLGWWRVADMAKGAGAWLVQAGSNPMATAALLALILLLGAALRFTGLDWDEHQHLHPDERFLTMVENSLEWPKSFADYLTSDVNPLNPYNRGHGAYVYGLLPLITAKFVGQVVGKTGYDGIYLVGRALSGVMDLLCVLLVYLTAKRLYGTKPALVGAFLLAVTVLNIQQSHYFTVDTSTTLYVTLALYMAVRVAQGEGWKSTVGLAIAFGLAVAAKISVLSFLLVIGLAYLLRYLAPAQEPTLADGPPRAWRARVGRWWVSLHVREESGEQAPTQLDRLLLVGMRTAVALVGILIVALFVFRLAQPQAFTGPGLLNFKVNPRWQQDMDYIRKLVSGQIDYPPSHQWAAREPVWYMLKNLLLWGMGLPLGLAVWASWAYMAYEIYFRRKWAHLLPWVWMTFTFFYQSIQFVKTVRYLLPIYPTMALMAGYGLWRLWQWARNGQALSVGWRRWARIGAYALVAVVMVGTTFWALAFTSIYTRPVTRVAASRWMYQNLPQGSTIGWEVWDDPLPLNVDGRNASIEFRQIKMENYWEDLPEKREQLLQILDEVQYISLSSNRLYGSIPRLPTRYPMTTRYYEALFSGELGFDELITFTSRPRLLGIEINDDDSDESFTVYDHPKVILFVKRPDFSLERAQAVLGDDDLERIVRVMPIQVTKAPNNLMLSEATAVAQREGGTWSDIFQRDSLSNRLPTLIWLLTIWLLGLVAFPIGFVAFRRLRDRGYVLSKTLGLLLLGYLAWLAPSYRVLPFARGTIWLMLGILTVISAALAWHQRAALAHFVRSRWRLIVSFEALWLAFFLAFWLVRLGNPDLWHPVMGGEKPMDMAYLNAIIKSTYFPPYDPWFAGGYINYYYFGWVIVATVIKLTGIVPWVAYNLTLPTYFALVAMGACSIVYNLIPEGQDEAGWAPRALRYGLVGALLVAVVGNLGELKLILGGLQQLGQNAAFPSKIPGLSALAQTISGLGALLFKGQQMPFRSEWWYWNASRIMRHGEINEFPYFSFLYADLHAHVTAMPFAVLALGLATSLVVRPVRYVADCLRQATAPDVAPEEIATPRPSLWQRALRFVRRGNWPLVLQLSLLALTLGELWCNNSWDFPTYTGVALIALAIGVYAEWRQVNQRSLTSLALRAGYVLALSLLLYRPYHANFGLAYSSVEPWKGQRTPIGDYLLIHGPALFILATYVITLALDRKMRHLMVRALRLQLATGARRVRCRYLSALLVRRQTLTYELGWTALAFCAVLLLALLLAKAWVLLFILPLLGGAAALILSARATPERRFVSLLIATGLALTLAVEYVAIKGDIGRMNTVFKFYLQVWIMWGIAAAVGLAYLWPRQVNWGEGNRRTWRTVLSLLMVSVALYPIFASAGKVRDRWDPSLPPGLDGMQYMTTARYHDNNRELSLEHDRQAIVWMQDNIVGSPVIAEANTPLYRWGNRIANYTGLPAIIGWDWHQKQQRAAVSGIVVDWRLQDLNDLYNNPDMVGAQRILQRYHVGYIYVGELEQAYYSPEGLAKFDRMVGTVLEVAYQRGPVTIYRVVNSGARELGHERGLQPTARSVLDWLSRYLILGPVRAEGPEKQPSGDLVQVETSRSLMLDRPVEELPVLRDRGWNRPAVGSATLAILVWWLVLQGVGLAAWPITARVAGHLGDGGYGLAKPVGLLLVSYLLWIGSSLRLLTNSPPAAWGSVLAVGAVSFFLWRRQHHRVSVDARPRRRLLIVEEALFSLCFLVFVGLRILNPDLWQPWFGGEKMMEIAFLNAITKSAHMPPYDPYFAGGIINYYYYGLFITSTLIKLTGLTPEIGFNLAVPTFFALTAVNAFVVGYAVSQPLRAAVRGFTRRTVGSGLACVAFVGVLGNLTGAGHLLEQALRAGGAELTGALVTWKDALRLPLGFLRMAIGQVSLPEFDYWYRGTRVIPYTINEFPFFSFLFADLHPHMMAIPFTILCVALSYAALLPRRASLPDRLLSALVLALALGALGVINTWDVPVYWGLAGVGLLFAGYRAAKARGLLVGGLSFLLIGLLAVLLYSPFYARYQAQYVGLALVPGGERSPLGAFLIIWGAVIAICASVLAMACVESWQGRRLVYVVRRFGYMRTMRLLWAMQRRQVLMALGGVVLGLAGLAVTVWLGKSGAATLALLVPLVVLSALLVLKSLRDGATFMRRLLVLAGLLILAGIEVVYMRDFLADTEWRRMNTVFKFSIQAWVLLGLGLGASFPELWRWLSRRTPLVAGAWKGVCALLLLGALSYTLQAIPTRVNERFPSGWPPRASLDGTAYMTVGSYAWPDAESRIELAHDREAIAWLWEHVAGTPVLAEAPIGYYREGGLRATSYTGLPTLVGMHQVEQRPWEEVGARERDAERLFKGRDEAEFWEIVARHHVRYIYVGQLERVLYGGYGLDKFDRLANAGSLERAYANDRVTIFRVP
jgi:YYY domain-containing protein